MEASREAGRKFLELGKTCQWIDPSLSAVEIIRRERGHEPAR